MARPTDALALLPALLLIAAALLAAPAAAQALPNSTYPYPVPSTTVDKTACVLYGVTPNSGSSAALKPFQSAFWVDPVDPAWPAGDRRWLPAYTSLPIYGAAPNTKITTVLISWHGITAYTNGHFCHVYGQYVLAENRQRNTLVGIVPSANDRRWTAWRRWGGSTVAGWCARGVRVAERDGAEGFTTRTVVIDRLLVVGVRDGATWAAWTEGLVLEQGGWRLAPWVPHAASVEAPRRAHPDVDLWDCDLARRPATSAPPPGG